MRYVWNVRKFSTKYVPARIVHWFVASLPVASRSIPKSNSVEIIFRFVVKFFIGVFVPWFVGAFLIPETSQKFRHRAEFLAFDSFLAVIVSTPCWDFICVHAAKSQAAEAPLLEEEEYCQHSVLGFNLRTRRPLHYFYRLQLSPLRIIGYFSSHTPTALAQSQAVKK